MKKLMTGNWALGEGAIQAGCDAYFGYPITPQNEMTEYMSRRMPEEGRTFLQSESELASISMVMGAATTGVRVMTSSSSPGISLMQEGISYMCGCELPAIIANMVRGGPGLGNIWPAQSDYYQSVKGGGHGDYRMFVLAPASVQEMFDFNFLGFDLAFTYRTPVLILSDGLIGQMMEPLDIREPKSPRVKNANYDCSDWALTGAVDRAPRHIKSLYLGDGVLEQHNLKLQKKYKEMEKELLYESYMSDDAEFLFVAYGTSARISHEVVHRLREDGIRAGLLRPITLWPFPEKIISDAAEKVRHIFTVELSHGQMVDDVRLAVNGRCPVSFYGRAGGAVMTVDELEKVVREKIEKE